MLFFVQAAPEIDAYFNRISSPNRQMHDLAYL